jgi:hypothetical protein
MMDATTSGSDAIPFDSICTCKTCSHNQAVDCINAGCNCCKGSNHSMVMDGIEGFLPEEKDQKMR